jgi:ketosteroid isomerase-like protein
VVSLEAVDAQEARFATAFGAGDISVARSLYAADVVYISPTTRLFGWPPRIVGAEVTLAFIQLTITGLSHISYTAEECALIGDAGAYVRVQFDFDLREERLRSTYVVVYRYHRGLIAQQELYYDPSGNLERVTAP